MSKSTYIKAISDFVRTHPDDNINGTLVYALYENGNGTLRHNGILYTLVEIKPNGEHNLAGIRENNGKNVHTNLCKLPLSVLEIVWENMKKRYEPETIDTRKAVKDRTYEVAEEMKKRIEPLIERAFMTGTFDCDEAYKNGYVIPKAIMAAVFKTIMNDTMSCPEEYVIREEADNIAEFL
jgi:hypothetical protein